jgi:hypothetical protein
MIVCRNIPCRALKNFLMPRSYSSGEGAASTEDDKVIGHRDTKTLTGYTYLRPEDL